jgi:hopanoid biosynthesis associated protein HpnK
VRRLIVNADDLGLTSGVNRAILEAHRNGIVTSTTLMATAPKFAEAARLVQSETRLSVGCHVVLVSGSPPLDRHTIPTLFSQTEDSFRRSFGAFARDAVFGRISPDEIEAEATAQIRKLQAAGVAVSHFDSHKHAHMFPQVLKPLLRAAKTCGLRAVRTPFEVMHSVSLSPRGAKRRIQVPVLRMFFAGKFRDAAKEAGFVTPDGCIGIAATGVLDRVVLQNLIEHLPEGTWELVCHPGYNDSELVIARTRLRESRQQEFELLTSPEALKLLEKYRIGLISYRDLA